MEKRAQEISKSMVKRWVIRVVGEERYYAARAKRNFRRAVDRNQELLFIHQMGKVGSMAIVKSLHDDSQAMIYHTHFMTPEGTSFVEELETDGYGHWSAMPSRKKNFLISSRVIGQELRKGFLDSHRVKVISLVRDPVATNLSGFFFNAHWWPSKLYEQCRSESGNYLLALQEHFLEAYPHDVPLTWFDMEMKPLFGIDVFERPFDKGRGYETYNDSSADLLLLKLERLRSIADEAISGFLGLHDFKLARANEAGDKWYGDLYQEFRSKVPLPESYLDRLYNTRFMQQFYSDEDIESLRRKWLQL